MWTQILAYFLLILFVLCYVVIGYYIADLLGNDKSEFKTYLIGVFWPVVTVQLVLMFIVIFIIGFFLVTGFMLVVIFNIVRSLIKGEKIDWDKPIF
jgi:hypothetical protein